MSPRPQQLSVVIDLRALPRPKPEPLGGPSRRHGQPCTSRICAPAQSRCIASYRALRGALSSWTPFSPAQRSTARRSPHTYSTTRQQQGACGRLNLKVAYISPHKPNADAASEGCFLHTAPPQTFLARLLSARATQPLRAFSAFSGASFARRFACSSSRIFLFASFIFNNCRRVQ